MTGPAITPAPAPVLSTLEPDGSRRKLHPRLSPGRWWSRRRAVGWGLIALFVLLPHLRVGGKPVLLLDVLRREFTVLGTTFGPADTPHLMLLLLAAFTAVFLFTALMGRVWCGWGCPQTVYLELLFRPLERWLEGSPQERVRRDREGPDAWRLLKWGLYLLVSFLLANTFLAYFVGTDRLWTWMRSSPLAHPGGFLVVALTTAAMLLDFGWFREQTCLVACPYGRFQSVLLDPRSVIVGYDRRRGEPRKKPGRLLPLAGSTEAGDCVDCRACVNTCPTGIDIRDGLQMECIQCAQCIDACDAIMVRLGRPTGLVRYASEEELAGRPAARLRPRVVLYGVVLAGLLAALAIGLARRGSARVTLLRDRVPYALLEGGALVGNQLRLRVENRTGEPREYRIALDDPDGRLIAGQPRMPALAGQRAEAPLSILLPRTRFERGEAEVVLVVADGVDFEERLEVTLVGPR